MRKIMLLSFVLIFLTACGGGSNRTYAPAPPIPPSQNITGTYSLVEKGAVDWVPNSGEDCSYFAGPRYAPYHGGMTITDSGFDMVQYYIDRPRGETTESSWDFHSIYPATDDPGIHFSWGGQYLTDPKYVYPYLSGEMWPYYYTYDQEDPKGLFLTMWTGWTFATNRYDSCFLYSIWEKVSN